jgi:cardiolipin synthase
MESSLPFSLSLAIYISEWLVRLVMLFVIVNRHPPRTAVAWLLVVFFLPWLGLILYFLVGENRLPRRRIKLRKALLERYGDAKRLEALGGKEPQPRIDDRFLPTVTLAEKLSFMPIRFGNESLLLVDTDKVIDQLVEDIDAAQKNVHLLFYIFAADETGQRIGLALERAVRRGVKCRLLVDAVGSRDFLNQMASHLKTVGVEVQAALPVTFLRAYVARLDLRNHRKIVVIDGKIGYAGSQNIVNANYGYKSLKYYDIMVRLSGPVVVELQIVFANDWCAESDQSLADVELSPCEEEAFFEEGDAVQALASGPLSPVENYQRQVVTAIHAARKQVTITTPYFVPDEVFLEALETAALKGVRVDLIVPAKSDHLLVSIAACAFYEQLLESGVNVYLFHDGLLHAKSMTIDDSVAFLGSSNFDIRSFRLNFEINMIFYGSSFTEKLTEQQANFRKNSESLLLSKWRNRPLYKQFIQNVFKLLSPVL